MSKIGEAIHTIHYMDAMAAQEKWINQLHPLSKLLVTVWFIVSVLSFHKYDFLGLAGMGIYLLMIFMLGEIPAGRCLRQMKMILLIVCAVGIANPFLDRTTVVYLGEVAVSGGVVSMGTLMLKGVFAVLASYSLIVTTSVEEICYALRLLHVPKTFVTVLLLIYRYIIVLLKETQRIMLAYEMRAPGQKGIHMKAWGSLAGQLLLRSIDRAQLVYESMILRGFDGGFRGNAAYPKKRSILYAVCWIFVLLIFRMVPVFVLAGNIVDSLIR